MSNKKRQSKNQSSQQRRPKKKSMGTKIKNFIINLLMLALLLIGLALVFNNQIKNYLVKDTTNKHTISNVTREDVKKNEEKEATFDFDQVESLDFNLVAQATKGRDTGLNTIGGIAIPSVKLNLPIFKGVSNYVLAVGAGTMKEEQRMGTGNYALASHYMYDPSLLFAPLVNVELGSSILLTDLEYIYEYKVTYKEYVEPTRVEVIDDVPGKEMVTLVTCDVSGANRLIVQGELIREVKGKEAPKHMQEAFEMDQTNYY
ncbi:class A sortase [Vagococcus fluvialis]|uniref:class A sortase n=1 Tax=Vagococcus fluvialis TaxID=2738 RepID=UPI003B59DB89